MSKDSIIVLNYNHACFYHNDRIAFSTKLYDDYFGYLISNHIVVSQNKKSPI
jgi:hypothetical protein